MDLLTIDLGNSAAKACWWRREGARTSVAAHEAWPTDPEVSQRLREWLEARSVPRELRVGLSNVASAEIGRDLAKEIASRPGATVVEPLDSGLANATERPDAVGRDRLFAARGAYELLGRSAIVIDAGTALTVDALRADAKSPRPTFLGGAIAPGARALGEALASATARLPRVDVRGLVPALGRDTASAIRSGIVHGLRGAARELARAIAAECGLAGCALVVTGGGRTLLLDPPAFEGEVVVDEHLVHRGLACALLDAPGAVRTLRHGTS